MRGALWTAALLALSVSGSSAQIVISDSLRVSSRESKSMQVPFEPGEELLYDVKFGWWTVGEGFLKVGELEKIRDRWTYHVQMGIEGRRGRHSIEYTFHSWMDIGNLASLKYIQDQRGFNERFREFDIFPDEQRWQRVGVDKSGLTLSEVPLDQVSFIYYVRTLPLEVGQEYVLDQYFKEEDNPVIIRVLRKERKEVPAGTFDCIVIQPIIRTSGLFGDGGQAEIYLTDDENRHMVYMKSRLPILPDIHLNLKEVR